MILKRPLFIFISILIVCVLVISQLNFKKLAYNHADWLIKREVLSIFKFYSPQQEKLKTQLDEYMSWHRKKMLPRYINFLGEFDDRIRLLELDQKKFSPEETHQMILKVRSLYQMTLTQLALKIRVLLGDLKVEQIDRTQTLLDRRLDQWRKLTDVPKDILLKELRYSWVGNFEQFLGPLHPDQMRVLEKTIFRLYIPPKFQLAYEGRMNMKLMEALRTIHESSEGESGIERNEVMLQLNSLVEYWQKESQFPQWTRELSKLVTKILNLADKKQIENMRKEIQSWRELMTELIS